MWRTGPNFHSDLAICDGSLEARVNLPQPKLKVYIVFTRVEDEGYSMKLGRCMNSKGRIHTYVTGNGGAYMCWARDKLNKAFAAGYRYVHVEYD
jgi:hypothetical protein